ncbi:MAG: hypothetical protein HN982_07200 [Candidatus Marinimicrobia bacterium]|jgi:hypothetical protein|nr:hypothetical protein [Candidatus Neomarinimicrobiota bacterium]MBT7901194.1 hypothetical protein [Candidatus Neomarinimicrobiota bacterium]
MNLNEEQVRAENSFSHQSKPEVSLFLSEKKRFDEENAIINDLKKRPMTESQVSEMVERGRSSVEVAEVKTRLRKVLDEMRNDGLIVPDTPATFTEFQSMYPDYNIIKASYLQQLSRNEYMQFRNAGKFKVFQDLKENEKVIHYQYMKGLGWQQTGDGMTIKVKSLHYPEYSKKHSREQLALISEAESRYKRDRAGIKSLFDNLGLVTDDNKPLPRYKG